MIFSPLEQFTIIPIILISNISIFIIYIIAILLILISINPFILQKHIEWFYSNLKGNINDHIFILLSIWFIILFSNLIGMIPYSITLTAQFIFVFSISIVVFISINILGFNIHKFNLTYLFLPTGVPFFLIPLIAILEFLLYFTRVISLTLRLSANMVAGHILMKILIYSFINLPIISLVLLPIIMLELMVAFLQAYVFLTLTISYYQDISLPH